ncbi:MAG TPA: heparinase II/III family protein [Microvirga sp.]|nr:heparinase II/III family protein [Microvirga sp.]
MDWGPDRWRLYGLALKEAGRAVRGRAACSTARFRAPVPKRLLFAPQDLRTADPTVATDIYGGFFVFAGRPLATGGRSPFEFMPLSQAWGEALYGFGWIRHLRAAGTALAQANARSLVDEFISTRGGHQPVAREPSVVARRLISFISQSPFVLEGADHAFYGRFLRALGRSVRDLEKAAHCHALPQGRLMAAVGLCYAGLCCEGLDGALKRGTRHLARELREQILPDGGHASRNPRVLIDLLFDLLPLRQMFASREVDTPEALYRAIDRMLPMVRLFRHGDGTLSHFNGMGVTAADHLATLLMYDDMRSQPIHHAPHSGYERLEAGKALVVADVGAAPPVRHSAEAGAGCLSFEFSSGRQRIIVNCGLPRTVGESVARASRSTAAHSTVAVGDESCCRFLEPRGWWLDRAISGWLTRRLGPVVLSGPAAVAAERSEEGGVQSVAARHDGYRRHGLTLERRWRLDAAGERLEGEDLFHRQGTAAEAEAVLRFHLAPGIRTSRGESGRAVTLTLPDDETWAFETSTGDVAIEDSVFFSAVNGSRRTEQIVLRVNTAALPEVRWRFERASGKNLAAARRSETAPEPA